MPSFIKTYLSDEFPLNERIFYLATFTSSIASLLFISLGLLLNLDFPSVCLYASICALGTGFFFLERKYHKTTLFSVVFLFYVNILCFPQIMYLQERSLVEIPIYSIIGLCYCLVLLKGAWRIALFTGQILMDIFSVYYCFVVKNQGKISIGTSTLEDYMRLEVSIVVTGLMCGVIFVFRNFLLEKELAIREAATKKAEMVSAAKDIFLVNVSHEIRTPLNAIIGTTDLLLDDKINNHVKEMAVNISNSSHALLSITSDLLDFSRMNINSITKEEDRFDISLMLNDIINLISVRLLDVNVDFIVSVNPSLPRFLFGDSGKIRQVIINMLSNAVKYTREGYMKLSVDYKECEDGKIKLLVSVEDTGAGIKKENLESIFETKLHSEAYKGEDLIEGNGLGLALCRKLCNVIGGKIYAESVFGEGSTFFFEALLDIDKKDLFVGRLEIEGVKICYFSDGLREIADLDNIFSAMGIESFASFSDEEFLQECRRNTFDYFLLSASSYERMKEKINDSGADWDKIVVISSCNYSYSGEPFKYVLTKPVSCLNVAALINKDNTFSVRDQKYKGAFQIPEATVLVVDDNLVNLDVAAGLLERYGCHVITAASGKEGLLTLSDEHVDIVYLDYMMPDMDGIDTLKAIRNLPDERTANLPVICLTANVVSGAKEMFLNSGFNGYLSKPIETDMLEKSILENLPKEFIRAVMRKD